MTQETYKATEKYSAPKELIRQLLEAVSIRRVINVDDDHGRKEGSKESLEDVLGALQAGTIDCSVVMKLIPGEEGYHEMDIEDVIEHVTDAWDMLEMEHKVQLTHIATRESGDSSSVDEERDDETSIVTLPTLLEGVVDFEQMSFSEWRERGMSLLEDGKTTLLLLDRSFEKEGMSEIAGEELANEIVNNDDLSNVYVGLLTHTAQDAVQESSITAAVSEKCGDKGRPVIVIAKNRLFEEETFPEALRMILYAEELEVFRSHAVASLKKACDASVIFLNKVERYALMATFEAARREGVYETDNAIRMASLPAKRVLEKKLREEEFLVESLEKLRNAAGIELYLKSGQRPGELDKLAWSERFDDKEHLSSLAMPIEVGDVFRFYNQVSKSGDDKYFILLAQPCDVSVRADGKRSNDLDSFVLTQITPAAFDKRSGEYKGVKHGQKDIGCLLPDSDVPWRVSFSKQIRVPALALDACAVSGDGRSVIGPNVCPSSKLPSSWMRRFERMKQESGKIIERFRAMNKAMVPVEDMKREAADAKKQLAASLAGAGVTHSKGVTATIDLGESVVVYGVERYARVTERTASGLLLLLSNHHARPAFEGDLFHDI